jgi:hypothetical protein
LAAVTLAGFEHPFELLDAPFPDFCGNIAAQEELVVVVWRKELNMSDFRGGTMIKRPHSGESRLQGSTALHPVSRRSGSDRAATLLARGLSAAQDIESWQSVSLVHPRRECRRIEHWLCAST